MGCYNKLYMTMPVESIEAILAEKDKEIERLEKRCDDCAIVDGIQTDLDVARARLEKLLKEKSND